MTTPGKASRQNIKTNLGYKNTVFDPNHPERLSTAWRGVLAEVAGHGRPQDDSQLQVGFSQDRPSAENRFSVHTSNASDLGTLVKGDIAIPKNVSVWQCGLVVNGPVPEDFAFEEFGCRIAKEEDWKLWNNEKYVGVNAHNRSGCVLYAAKIDSTRPRMVGYSGRGGREQGLIKKVRNNKDRAFSFNLQQAHPNNAHLLEINKSTKIGFFNQEDIVTLLGWSQEVQGTFGEHPFPATLNDPGGVVSLRTSSGVKKGQTNNTTLNFQGFWEKINASILKKLKKLKK